MLVSSVPSSLFPSVAALPKSARLSLELVQARIEAYKCDDSRTGKIAIALPCGSGERVLVVVDLTSYQAKLKLLNGFEAVILEAFFTAGIRNFTEHLRAARRNLAEQLSLPVVPKAAKSIAINHMQKIKAAHDALHHLVTIIEPAEHNWFTAYRVDAAMSEVTRLTLSRRAPSAMPLVKGAGSVAAVADEEEALLALAGMGIALSARGGRTIEEKSAVCEGAADITLKLARLEAAASEPVLEVCAMLADEAIATDAAAESLLRDSSPTSDAE